MLPLLFAPGPNARPLLLTTGDFTMVSGMKITKFGNPNLPAVSMKNLKKEKFAIPKIWPGWGPISLLALLWILSCVWFLMLY